MCRSEDRSITHAHDKLFKRVLSNPAHASSELKAILPPALVARIDWGSLNLKNTTAIDHELRARYSDLVFTARTDGQDSIIYILFEHQSTPDRFIALRMLGYLVRIWEQIRDRKSPPEHLPPILPVLLQHTNAERASVPIVFAELFHLAPGDADLLRPFLPNFQLVLDDLDALSIEQLKDRKLPALLELALALLKLSRTKGSLLEKLEQFVDTLRRADDGTLGIATLISYILEVRDESPNKVRQFFHKALGPSGLEAYVTGAEMLVAEEREKALVQGQATLLLRQLARKFGPLSSDAVERVRHAPPADLEHFADRILTASSLDEVLEDQS